MKRVYCPFHESQHYGRQAFKDGLEKHGYVWSEYFHDIDRTDLLLIWNRGSLNTAMAQRFEAAGARVLVAENGYLGKYWRGLQWYALALGHHNGGGHWHNAGPERWDRWGVPLAPWRKDNGESIILAQRSIGEEGIAMPHHWSLQMHTKTGIRVRQHPGKDDLLLPLEKDLQNVSTAITWASGAGIKCIIMGIPVFYGYAHWIGGWAGTWLNKTNGQRHTDDVTRLHMLRDLAWAQWTRNEVTEGLPFEYLLNGGPA